MGMSFEDRLRAQGVKVNGTFDAQKFFDIFAGILSRKYGVEISAKVKPKIESDQEEKKDGECNCA